MLVTNHVLSGAVIGAVVRRPVPAFVLGVASHFVLDSLPHWGPLGGSGFLKVAVPDGLTGLAVMGVMTAVAPPERRAAVLAAMAGAAFPDLDKPSKLWFGRSPFPRAWDQFHGAIQDEALHRAPYEAVAATIFSSAAIALLRGRASGASR
jgi:hypothetical protein